MLTIFKQTKVKFKNKNIKVLKEEWEKEMGGR